MELFEFEAVLEQMAYENRKHFSPHYVNSRGDFNDLKSVTELLLQRVGSQLRINLEVECPEGHNDFAIDSLAQLPEENVFCSVCWTEYTPSIDDIWVSFDFTQKYLDFIKKKTIGLSSTIA